MIATNFGALLRAMESITQELPDVPQRATERVGKMMMVSLASSKKWNDQTFQLRSAFEESFSTSADATTVKIDVDPSVAGRRRTNRGEVPSKTPPNTYARFLNFGTTRISARAFMTDAWEIAKNDGRLIVVEEFAKVMGSQFGG